MKVPKIEVMSREKFLEYCTKPHKNSSIVVSITSFRDDLVPQSCIAMPGNNILTVYRAVFDDVDTSPRGMNEAQALEIAQFVKQYGPSVDKIIVHCGAGQSRSAGVAAAILKWFTGDDMQIFGNGRYTPNMRCYRLTLEAMYLG